MEEAVSRVVEQKMVKRSLKQAVWNSIKSWIYKTGPLNSVSWFKSPKTFRWKDWSINPNEDLFRVLKSIFTELLSKIDQANSRIVEHKKGKFYWIPHFKGKNIKNSHVTIVPNTGSAQIEASIKRETKTEQENNTLLIQSAAHKHFWYPARIFRTKSFAAEKFFLEFQIRMHCICRASLPEIRCFKQWHRCALKCVSLPNTACSWIND